MEHKNIKIYRIFDNNWRSDVDRYYLAIVNNRRLKSSDLNNIKMQIDYELERLNGR